jgi:protein-S-isoprenylcysteine O-methyltransferase Ste14
VEPLVFQQPAAAIPFGALVAAWALSEWVQQARGVRARDWRGARDAGSYFVVLGATLAGVLAGFALAGRGVLRLPLPAVWVVAGLAVGWAGFLLRLWAELTLGRFFTLRVRVAADQPVVTTGPYRLVRHPAYLGILAVLFGLGLALGSLASALLMLALPAAGLARRIAVEEAALRDALGAPYVAYCRGRARLIPGVW